MPRIAALIAFAVVLAAGALTVSAQVSSLAITDYRLANVMTDARLDRLPVFDDVVAMRGLRRGKPAEPEPQAPFRVFVATPYMRAVSALADAKRRFEESAPLSVAGLNGEGIVVSVSPGETFAAADAIENVVVRQSYDDSIARAWRNEVAPTTIQNGGGATRVVTEGVFYFKLADFERLPVTLVCIGRTGNYTLQVTADDLKY